MTPTRPKASANNAKCEIFILSPVSSEQQPSLCLRAPLCESVGSVCFKLRLLSCPEKASLSAWLQRPVQTISNTKMRTTRKLRLIKTSNFHTQKQLISQRRTAAPACWRDDAQTPWAHPCNDAVAHLCSDTSFNARQLR